MYQPNFAVGNLEGAVYEITAAEDIVTLEGTVRAKKGEVVDTLTHVECVVLMSTVCVCLYFGTVNKKLF